MTGILSTGKKSNLEFGEYKKRFTIVQDEMKSPKLLNYRCYMSKKQEIIGIQYFAETFIVRHTKVAGDKSIYDNDLVYWSDRGRTLGNRAFSKSILRILRKQDNKCNICNLKFLPGDVIEIDHIVSKTSGGTDHYGNLQALHGYCHDQKS